MQLCVAAIVIATALVANAGIANAVPVKLDVSASSPFRDAPANADRFRNRNQDWDAAGYAFRRTQAGLALVSEGFRWKTIDPGTVSEAFVGEASVPAPDSSGM